MDRGDGRRRWLRWAVVTPYLWLLIFFLAPFAIIFKISLADPLVALPPFTALINWVESGLDQIHVTLDNYIFLFQDSFYAIIYINSIKIAAIGTFFCLLLGYPIAYFIARQPVARRNLLLLGIILPFWISFLLRVYAWIGLLNNKGIINNLLMWLGIIDGPLPLIYNDFAVYIGIVYSYLPFMILPLYANLERMDLIQKEADESAITQSELDLVKSKVCSQIVRRSERPSSRLFAVGNNWLQRQNYTSVKEAIEAYQAVTLADIHQVLEAHPLSRTMTVSVGPSAAAGG